MAFDSFEFLFRFLPVFFMIYYRAAQIPERAAAGGQLRVLRFRAGGACGAAGGVRAGEFLVLAGWRNRRRAGSCGYGLHLLMISVC